MPLNPGVLRAGIVDIESSFPGDAFQCGKRWADAYAHYAADAISPMGGAPASLDVGAAVLGNALGVAFSNPRQLAPQTAQQMASAFTAFWFVPPVVFAGVPPGAVTAVQGTSLLVSALLSAWAASVGSRMDAERSAALIATALDAFTRTVIVTHPVIPTPVVGPIS